MEILRKIATNLSKLFGRFLGWIANDFLTTVSHNIYPEKCRKDLRSLTMGLFETHKPSYVYMMYCTCIRISDALSRSTHTKLCLVLAKPPCYAVSRPLIRPTAAWWSFWLWCGICSSAQISRQPLPWSTSPSHDLNIRLYLKLISFLFVTLAIMLHPDDT